MWWVNPGGRRFRGSSPRDRALNGPFDFVIANAENAAGGFGLTRKIMEELFGFGIDALTSGNHIWDNRDALLILDEEMRLVRPANYPSVCRGSGSMVVEKKGLKLAILNLQGRVFMQAIDCPFRRADEEIAALRGGSGSGRYSRRGHFRETCAWSLPRRQGLCRSRYAYARSDRRRRDPGRRYRLHIRCRNDWRSRRCHRNGKGSDNLEVPYGHAVEVRSQQ